MSDNLVKQDVPAAVLEALLYLAAERYGEGRADAALEVIDALIILAPKDARVFRLQGAALALCERTVDAEQAFRTALELEADEPSTLAALIELMLSGLRFAEAEPLCRQLFSLDRDRTNPAANRVREMLHQLKKQFAA